MVQLRRPVAPQGQIPHTGIFSQAHLISGDFSTKEIDTAVRKVTRQILPLIRPLIRGPFALPHLSGAENFPLN
jgi:hypothetical protein